MQLGAVARYLPQRTAPPGQHLAVPKGIAVSKDVWMLGIGAGLVLDSAN